MSPRFWGQQSKEELLRAMRAAVGDRVVWQVRNEKGSIIDSQSEVGGWPPLKTAQAPADVDRDGIADDWEKEHGLNHNDPTDHRSDQDADGYTNLEEYVNSWAGSTSMPE